MSAAAVVQPPKLFHYYNNTTKPAEECATRCQETLSNPSAVIWMRRDDNGLNFEVFKNLNHAIHYVLTLPAETQCYYTIVKPNTPVEFYIDAEIEQRYCHTVVVHPVLPPYMRTDRIRFDTQMFVLHLWCTATFEALHGISCQIRGSNAWMFRADTQEKYSCHIHVPQWSFKNISDLSTAMRVMEDVLYTQRQTTSFNTHPLALLLSHRVVDRQNRRRPGCVTNSNVIVAVEDELVVDCGVYSSVRQMRMPEQRSKPSKANPLKLWQPNYTTQNTNFTQTNTSLDSGIGQVGSAGITVTGADLLSLAQIISPRANWRIPMPALFSSHELIDAYDKHASAIADKAMQYIAQVSHSQQSQLQLLTAQDQTSVLTATQPCRFDVKQHLREAIKHTWAVCMDEPFNSEPRLITQTLDTWIITLEAILRDMAKQTLENNAAHNFAHKRIIRTSFFRTVEYILLFARWIMPATIKNVSRFSVDDHVLLCQKYVAPLFFCSISRMESHPLYECNYLISAIYGFNNNNKLSTPLKFDLMSLQYKEIVLARLNADLRCVPTPVEMFQMASSTFLLELCVRYLGRADHMLVSDTGLRHFLSLNWIADVDDVLSCIVKSLTRGSLWHAHSVAMNAWLSTKSQTSTTRHPSCLISSSSLRTDQTSSSASSSSSSSSLRADQTSSSAYSSSSSPCNDQDALSSFINYGRLDSIDINQAIQPSPRIQTPTQTFNLTANRVFMQSEWKMV